MRAETLRLASDVKDHLTTPASPEEMLLPTEVEIRHFAHDFVTRDHDKDVRSFGALTPARLAGYALYTLSVDYYGRTRVDCLHFPLSLRHISEPTRPY